MKKVLLLLFLLSIFFGYHFTNKKQIKDRDDNINKILDSLVNANIIPGLNLSVIYENGNQKNYSSGYSNVERKIKLTPEHIMFSGSIGKTYAAALLLQLVDEGKVDLNKKIKDYFPEIDWLEKLPNIDDITVELLLQHRTGLPSYVLKPQVWDTLQANPNKVWTYKDRMAFIFGDKPIHEAAKGWAYSDTNYILIGMLIEKITGKYYYDTLKQRVFKPAGLSYTYATDKREFKNIATGYSKLPPFFKIPNTVVKDDVYCFNNQMEWTGGGIISTTPDLAKWGKKYYEGKLFSDSLLKIVITPNENGKMIGPDMSYGMGSFIFDTKHGKAYGHTGFVPGFVSIFAYYPDYKLTVAMQINCDFASGKMSLVKYLDKIVVYLK